MEEDGKEEEEEEEEESVHTTHLTYSYNLTLYYTVGRYMLSGYQGRI